MKAAPEHIEIDRWANRRAMAWLSLIAALLFPFMIFFTESAILSDIAMAFYLFTASVVGAYVGFATWDDINLARRGRRREWNETES